MATEVINEEYEIDLEGSKADVSCPYCDCNNFEGTDTEIVTDVFLNTCDPVGHDSIWKNAMAICPAGGFVSLVMAALAPVRWALILISI